MWFCEQDYLKSQGFDEELYSAWKRGTGEKLMIHPMNYNIFNFTVRCALLLRQFALWSCVTLKWLGLFYSRGWCCCIYVSQISWINEYWLNDDLIDWLIDWFYKGLWFQPHELYRNGTHCFPLCFCSQDALQTGCNMFY